MGDASGIRVVGSFRSGSRGLDCAKQVGAKAEAKSCLVEDDGAFAVEQNAVLCEPANGLSESFRLDVLTD